MFGRSTPAHRPRSRRRPARPFLSVLIILPGMLALFELLATQTELKFLLFPPLASIGYRIFRQPHGLPTHWRSVILAPTLGSLCGLGLNTWGGLNAPTTALAALAGIVIVEALRADAPPTLAVILLALFGTHLDWTFPASVRAATATLYLIFRIWRRLTHPQPAPGPRAEGGGQRRGRRWAPPSTGSARIQIKFEERVSVGGGTGDHGRWDRVDDHAPRSRSATLRSRRYVTPRRRQPRQVGHGLAPRVRGAREQLVGFRQHQSVWPPLPPGPVAHRQPCRVDPGVHVLASGCRQWPLEDPL